ncbi:hypothetical protein B0H34DRAFT_109952 [Crassisporium funariophilum]|nr:hypothetical protein B0H34DRAFT_109952 [Crassisporium funariophilum]
MQEEVQSLESLADEHPHGSKPVYSYATLVRCAILGSPRQTSTLPEILTAIETRFSYFKNDKTGNYKTYITNTLSNTPCFSPSGQPPHPPTHPRSRDQQLYWIYDPDADPELKAPEVRASAPSSPAPSTSKSKFVTSLPHPPVYVTNGKWVAAGSRPVTPQYHGHQRDVPIGMDVGVVPIPKNGKKVRGGRDDDAGTHGGGGWCCF